MKAIVLAQAIIPWCGGSAISEASLCSALTKYCDVTVICRQGALDYAYARSFGLNEIREYQPAEVFAAWRDKSHWLNALIADADIFHLNGHWKWEHHFLARLCERHGTPYVLHPRGMLLIGHRRLWLKRAFNLILGNYIVRHASRIIALSRFELSQYRPYGVKEEQVLVVPNGIPQPEISDSAALPKTLESLVPYFLYLGRLEERKNLVFLVDVFARYLEKGGKAFLLLVGPTERGYDKKIESRIAELGISDRARLLPPVYDDEKWKYLKHAKAVIYPTLEEPFGRVPFEAISAGAFPIIPDESGSAEYLKPFLPQCVYRHQDAESLLRTMTSIEASGANGMDMGLTRAREWVAKDLDWERIAGIVADLYRSILNQRKSKKVRKVAEFPPTDHSVSFRTGPR